MSCVADTSAIVSLLLKEPSWDWITETLEQSAEAFISAPTLVELSIVMRSKRESSLDARRVVHRLGLTVVSVDEELAWSAAEAWERFGRGRHAAKLSFGDCFTYALAEARDLPILCVGNDFTLTDLPVLCPPA